MTHTCQVKDSMLDGYAIRVGKFSYYPNTDNNSLKDCMYIGGKLFVKFNGAYRQVDESDWIHPELEQAF